MGSLAYISPLLLNYVLIKKASIKTIMSQKERGWKYSNAEIYLMYISEIIWLRVFHDKIVNAMTFSLLSD